MAGTKLWRGSTELVEQLNSPVWQFSDKTTVVRNFRGPHAACLAGRPPQGAFGVGDYLGLRVVQSTLQPAEKAGIWAMSYTMEGLPPSAPLPPDEGGTEMSQLEFALEKHPIYEGLSLDIKTAVRAAVDASKETDRTESLRAFAGSALANALYAKLLRGQTHFTLYVPVYKWTVSSYLAPTPNKGGYPQVPFGPFPVAAGFDWLRMGDTQQYTGNFWKLTRSWLAAKEWDTDIYPV
jgi:hypothetical protein